MARSGKVRHRLHHAEIGAERRFHKLFAIAGGRGACHAGAGAAGVNLLQKAADDGHRVAGVGLVAGVYDIGPLVNGNGLYRGAARVDANVDVAALWRIFNMRHICQGVPGTEIFVLAPVFKQRRMEGILCRCGIFAQTGRHIRQLFLALRIQRSAQRHIIQAVFRAGALRAKGFVKAAAQLG